MNTAVPAHASLEAYLFFEGRCAEAIEFYRTALGAEVVSLFRFKDCPDPTGIAPGMEEKVMHASLRIGGSTLLMSDGRCQQAASFAGFSLSLNLTDEVRAKELFGALGEGGTVMMPLAKTFWSPCFGMVTDRFGVLWMIHVVCPPAA